MSARGKPVVTSSRKRFRVQKSAKIAPIEESPTKREISPAKTEKGVGIDDMERTTRAVGPVYDAGGGSGFEGLTFDNLKEEQENMYMRTLSTTVLEDANVEQELRQLEIADEYITYIVNISREDFPSKSADLEVRFTPKALQAAWSQFLVDARVALDVEFVLGINDKLVGLANQQHQVGVGRAFASTEIVPPRLFVPAETARFGAPLRNRLVGSLVLQVCRAIQVRR